MFKRPLERHSATRNTIIAVILLLNTFTWFYASTTIVNRISAATSTSHTQNLTITTYYLSIVVFGIIGSTLPNKVRRISLLKSWILLGAVASLSSALTGNPTPVYALAVSTLLGSSLGLGMPSCLSYFADCTAVENRGMVSGLTWLTINLTAPIFATLLKTLDLATSSMISAIWRISGLTALLIKPKEFDLKMEKHNHFKTILHDRSFTFFFTVWLMFCLIDRLEEPILREFLISLHDFMVILGPVIGGFSALTFGMLSDRVGRKRITIYCFTALGLAYATIGIAPESTASWSLFLVVGSVSTGISLTLFTLILWGDLSQQSVREKYYAIGESPFFLASVIQQLILPQVKLIQPISAFSLASFFLFASALLLIYAPETLPERIIELKKFKRYVEKARKLKENASTHRARGAASL
jgi:MFS family permease